MQLSCPQCNKKFERETTKQVFCTPLCTRAHSTAKRAKPVNLFCSSCKSDYQLSKKTYEQSKNRTECIPCMRKRTQEERTQSRQCLVCGKSFKAKASENKICSLACAESSFAKPKEFKRYEKPNTVKANLINKMPCVECEYGKRSNYSDSGWECLANARTCSPFTIQKLFKPRAIQEVL